MMANDDQSIEINHNHNWADISDNSRDFWIIDTSGSRKINALLNLIKNQQPDIEKIYLYAKDPLESKYQAPINGREKIGIAKLKNPKAFTHSWNQSNTRFTLSIQ